MSDRTEQVDANEPDANEPDANEPDATAEVPAESDEFAQKRLGARLRESREYLGLSQQLVADRTGIPRTAISDIERGARKVDSLELRKLALIYSKPVGYFLDEDPLADPSAHTLQILTRATAGMPEEDRRKLVDYAQLLEVAARARRRPSR